VVLVSFPYLHASRRIILGLRHSIAKKMGVALAPSFLAFGSWAGRDRIALQVVISRLTIGSSERGLRLR
jgi:hypothetical protein